jgi:hypothetical protein
MADKEVIIELADDDMEEVEQTLVRAKPGQPEAPGAQNAGT